MELLEITANRLLKMSIACVRVNDSHLDIELILLQILMLHIYTLLNLLMKEIIINRV